MINSAKLGNGEYAESKFRVLQPKGDLFYIETPSPESIHFKSSKLGTLNFYDDKTHKRVYSLEELENLASENGYKLLKCGKRKDPRRILIFPFFRFDVSFDRKTNRWKLFMGF